MPKSLSLTRAKYIDIGKHIIVINFILAILSASFVLVYLFKTNDLTTSGYRLKTLNEQKETLLKEQEALQVELSRLQALPQVSAKIEGLGLQPISTVVYIAEPRSSPLAYDESTQSRETTQGRK